MHNQHTEILNAFYLNQARLHNWQEEEKHRCNLKWTHDMQSENHMNRYRPFNPGHCSSYQVAKRRPSRALPFTRFAVVLLKLLKFTSEGAGAMLTL